MSPILGLRTVIYPAPDLARAKKWYADAQAFWGVQDARAAYARLIQLGAKALEPVKDVGEGIKVGAVTDPFGNRFGIIENPHFKGGTS